MNIPATFRNKYEYPDRTRRAFDALNLHYQAVGSECGGHWIAIRLSDGSSDGQLYPSKELATRYQLHEKQCAYICLPPFGEMSMAELHRFIEINEEIYNAGGRLEDSGTHIVPRRI